MQLLRSLNAGSTIGVFAPGSPTHPGRVALGKKFLEAQGYSVSIPLDPAARYGKTGGSFSSESVEARVGALSILLDDPKVAVILAARGAYGTAEILPKLDFKKIAQARKAIVGYSDVTALVSIIPQLADIPAIHGPTLTKELAETSEHPHAAESAAALLKLLSDPDYRFRSTVSVMKKGDGEGRLLAGNLTVLTSLLGTPWEPDLTGKILVLEDAGEAPFRVHRMLTQLQHAGKFEQLAALCLGRFSKCEAKFPPTVEAMFDEFVSDRLKLHRFPVVAGLPVGHGGKNVPLPNGVRARVTGDQFEVLESPVERT